MSNFNNANTTSGRWSIEPALDQRVVNFDDPTQVAQELIDRCDYDGYSLMRQFSEQAIFALALEDATAIIDARRSLLAKRIARLPVIARSEAVPVPTVFVVSRSKVVDKQQPLRAVS